MAKTPAGEQSKPPTEIDLINQAIEGKGLSVNALADKAQIPQKTLSRRLNGDGLLTLQELRKIAAALEVWPSEILPDDLAVRQVAA